MSYIPSATQPSATPNPLIPEDEVFISAIAGRLDRYKKRIAIALHADGKGIIYWLYNFIDGLNLAYSLIKYYVDLACPNGAFSSDMLHNFMMSPVGMIVTIIETSIILSFAMLSVYFDGHDNKYLSAFSNSWGYFREVLKGLKNAYKGTRTIVQISNLLQTGANASNFLILPLSFSIGGIAVLNRIIYRALKKRRVDQMKFNNQFLTKLMQGQEVTEKEIAEIYAAFADQSDYRKNGMTYLAATVGGFVDSIYLYLGMMTLCPVSMPLFIALTALSVAYCLICIGTRIFEEYDYQRKIKVQQSRIKLELKAIALKKGIKEIAEAINKGENHNLATLRTLYSEFEEHRQFLEVNLLNTPLAALMQGLRNGLAAYGAFGSIIFATSAILGILSAPFPPVLLVTLVLSGIVLLAAYALHALYLYSNQQTQASQQPDPFTTEEWEALTIGDEVLAAEIKQSLLTDPQAALNTPPPQSCENYEVIRSFFSGLGKGSKSIDYTFNPLLIMGENGHYQDSLPLLILGFFSGAAHCIILALNALAKGFGKPAADLLPERTPSVPTVANTGQQPVVNTPIGQSTAVESAQPAPSSKPIQKTSLGRSCFGLFSFSKKESVIPSSSVPIAVLS